VTGTADPPSRSQSRVAATLARREPQRRLRRIEIPALQGVLVREVINFSSYWRSTTFSSTVAGLPYVEFVATGTVATAVLFSSVFPAMFGTFVKYQFQRTYDAILAAPVDTEELVTAEALWIATRAGTFGCTPLLVAMVFGLDPAWTMLLVPFIGFITGFGWACFGVLIAAVLKSIDNFNYVTSTVITPLFLTAGTFFPISNLPQWAQVLAQFNPLHHCVVLVRHACFGLDPGTDLLRVGALLAFGLVMWRLAIWRMTIKLID